MDRDFKLQRKAKKHIHTYEYRRGQGYRMSAWMCNDPICSHFMPPNMEHFLIGRATLCNECQIEMVMDEDTMKMDKPICTECILKLRMGIVSGIQETEEDGFSKYLDSKETISDKFRK